MYCFCIGVIFSLGAVATFVVRKDFFLGLADLLLRAGVFTSIKYSYDVSVGGVSSSVVTFCAFYFLSICVRYGPFSGFILGRCF